MTILFIGEFYMKTQTTIRVDESSYIQAKEILNNLGLNYSQAISVFNKMIILNNGLPFEVKIQNTNTQKAIKELENKSGKTFKSVDELFHDLDS
ncbi:type II toxin-antitoxin system RelB/DinJ family antitoxin [Aliarcobacter butzleri]|uniref:Type II toxin-antitoxin system RelB/DinJ family antitoxin n=1 Tax=Aliarcobacter butzleri TaxID=28197 RepID=A0AAP4PC10_9BACT|nr:type II toxin-antitoxin system RelB/DinJ family antitoxin [Aliarcobacter butzleri]MCG3653899.1 type II toxin-antitoxin system RelB/DinJ family antitoxin [Aliarcobacter butzleri]MCG3694837.1 type II toxin-antitoxin system RelB/DinJ family antitoxin [Aliarcobacter butzleri]MCG3699160.1 type II toxin-antitoxin system RelB/DinJ family antitoxin [Aliarcobacter butzleri]MCT7557027.1 type II toxin-antitoxin system RelB/DinJ family antitoxin [Aliarcobacter butzleri]MCT7585016.1 type II toxin-antito